MFKSALFLLSTLSVFIAPATAETPTFQVLNQWLTAIDSGDSG
jgi:hypothetical protein